MTDFVLLRFVISFPDIKVVVLLTISTILAAGKKDLSLFRKFVMYRAFTDVAFQNSNVCAKA